MDAVQTGNTIVLQSGDAGAGQAAGGAYDLANGNSVGVIVTVSPAPPTQQSAVITTNTPQVVVATPRPLASGTPPPNYPSAFLSANAPNIVDSSHSVTATVGTASTQDALYIIKQLGVALWTTAADQTASANFGEYAAYKVNADCSVTGLNSPTNADVYIAGISGAWGAFADASEGQSNAINIPNGATTILNYSDVTKLTASQWANTATKFDIDSILPATDTIIGKAANGKIFYIALSGLQGGHGGNQANVVGGFGCLN